MPTMRRLYCSNAFGPASGTPPAIHSVGPSTVVDRLELHRAGRVEVAEPRRVGALVNVDRVDRLGDQEVGVGVALAVAVARHVDGHAVGVDRDVGAVIGIEAADEVLIRFSAAGVLADHQARHLAQDVGDLRARAVLRSSRVMCTDDADSAGAVSSISMTSSAAAFASAL